MKNKNSLNRPKYWVDECFFGSNDCTGEFERISTLHGQCLTINANKLNNYDPYQRFTVLISKRQQHVQNY